MLTFILVEYLLSDFILNPRKYKSKVPEINFKSKLLLQPDTTLGWNVRPGKHIQGADKEINILYTYSRFSGKDSIDSQLKTVAFYGCSFGFGQGLSDDEVFSYHLQKNHPELNILNQSVPAFSNVQMFMKLKNDVANNFRPDKVVLLWADFHPFRNIPTESWRIVFGIGLGQKLPEDVPYPTIQVTKDSFKYFMKPVEYYRENGLISSRSAFFCSIKYFINYINDNNNYSQILKSTICVIRDMNKFCLANNVKFEVATLMKSKETQLLLKSMKSEGIIVRDISLPFENGSEYTLEDDPFHPNAKAHIYFANGISKWLNDD